MAVSNMITAILESNATIVSTCGVNIYPDVLVEDYTLPAISYTVNNITITETKDTTTSWDEVDVTITAYATSRIAAESLAALVRTTFSRVSGSYGSQTVITGNHRGERWDFQPFEHKPGTQTGAGIFTQEMDFRIVYK